MSERENSRRIDGDELIRTLARNSPEFEPPPFFSARVAALAFSETPSLIVFLGLTARRLMPGLLVLIMVATFFLARMENSQVGLDEGEWLFATHQDAEEELITLDFVVESLRSEFSSGGNGGN